MTTTKQDRARSAFNDLISSLDTRFSERTEFISGLALATLAREHVFVIGPPGTAKTEITQEFCRGMDSSLFDYLVMRTSTPDEVFGPFDIKALREEGKMTRRTEGFAPRAQVILLDEIWKGSSTMLNGFLRMMSQREFNDGGQVYRVPLLTLIGASNELPDDEDGLEALYDRFALRYSVDHIKDESALRSVIFDGTGSDDLVHVDAEDLEVATAAVAQMPISEEAQTGTMEIVKALEKEGVFCSSRRLAAAVRIARAEAWLAGRSEVAIWDMNVLQHVLWEDPHAPERRVIQREVQKRTAPQTKRFQSRVDALVEQFTMLGHTKRPGDVDSRTLTSAMTNMDKLIAELERIKDNGTMGPSALASFKQVLDSLAAKRREVVGLYAQEVLFSSAKEGAAR